MCMDLKKESDSYVNSYCFTFGINQSMWFYNMTTSLNMYDIGLHAILFQM